MADDVETGDSLEGNNFSHRKVCAMGVDPHKHKTVALVVSVSDELSGSNTECCGGGLHACHPCGCDAKKKKTPDGPSRT
jgi:hypothetical protein